MTKRFTLMAACALTMISPVLSQDEQLDVEKLRADHERLIDVVLSLEADFGETLRDYAKLQKDFAEVLKRPTVPDQSGKVRELQKQLEEATAKLKESKGGSGVDALVMGDLRALRNELHRERGALLVAKAQLSQLQNLKTRTAELEKLLEGEEARSAESMAKLEVVRGERDALMVRLNEMLKRAEVSEKALVAANEKIQVLEKETGVLKVQIAKRDKEINELKANPVPDKVMMVAVENLKKEGVRLAGDLEMREKELETLRAALAAEKKRSLDVPMLLKARKDLEARLASHSSDLEATQAKLMEAEKMAATAEKLKKENAELLDRYRRLAGDFEALTGSIAAMEAELKKTREEMMVATKAGMQVKDLEMQKVKLTRDLEAANANLAKVEGDLKLTSERLTESQEKVKVVEADLAKRDADLKAMRVEMAGSPDLTKKVAQLEAEKAEVVAKHQKILEAQMELKKSLNEASVKLLKANESAAEAEKLKADYDSLASRAAAIEKEKVALATDLARGNEAMKSLQAAMSEGPAQVAKLEEEKKKLAAELASREEDLKKARVDLGKLHLNSAALEKQLVSLKRSSVRIDPVRYAKGDADVNDQQARVLGQVQSVLETFPSARFEIVGHTCDLGSKEGNLRLSNDRAKALLDFLVEKGVPADRLKARGVGDADPVMPNTNEENRGKNRRVEVEILD